MPVSYSEPDQAPRELEEETQGMTFSAHQFLSSTDFYTHALEMMPVAVMLQQDIVYTDVPNDWGTDVFEWGWEGYQGIRKHYNAVTRTFWLHAAAFNVRNCHRLWLEREMERWVDGEKSLLTGEEYEGLRIGGGLKTINIRYGLYTGSRQEPDCFIRSGLEQYMPTLVLISAWSESRSQLLEDMKLWLVGGNGDVRAVIILIWESDFRHHHRQAVMGTAELYTLDTDTTTSMDEDVNGYETERPQPVLRQRERVFPAPPSAEQAQKQAFSLTRKILFGPMVDPERDPDEVLPLSVEGLRKEARVALKLVGLEETV